MALADWPTQGINCDRALFGSCVGASFSIRFERSSLYAFCTVVSLRSCWMLNLVLDLQEGYFHTSGMKLNCNRATTILWSDDSVAPP